MMVSDQHRQDPQSAATETGAQAASAAPAMTQAIDMSAMIPFPKSEEETTAMTSGIASQPLGFAPLPFDESLIAASGANSNAAASIASNSAAAAAIGLPNFFLDTAALAQHLAAVVADEKKLSDVRSFPS